MSTTKIDPKNNQLNVSQMRSPNFFAFIAKAYLEKFPTVELHSIGNAMNVAIRVADILVKYKYVKYKKISTVMTKETYTPKAKLVLELERTADFKKLVADYNKAREEEAKKKA